MKSKVTEADLMAALNASLTPAPAEGEITIRKWAKFKGTDIKQAGYEIMRLSQAGKLEPIGWRVENGKRVKAYKAVL